MAIKVKVEDIQQAVIREWNLPADAMKSQSKAYAIVRPRQIAMYLARRLTKKSYPDLGRLFGGKDHTTIYFAYESIDKHLRLYPKLAERVRRLEVILRVEAEAEADPLSLAIYEAQRRAYEAGAM